MEAHRFLFRLPESLSQRTTVQNPRSLSTQSSSRQDAGVDKKSHASGLFVIPKAPQLLDVALPLQFKCDG
jgi:hypothetical protein